MFRHNASFWESRNDTGVVPYVLRTDIPTARGRSPTGGLHTCKTYAAIVHKNEARDGKRRDAEDSVPYEARKTKKEQSLRAEPAMIGRKPAGEQSSPLLRLERQIEGNQARENLFTVSVKVKKTRSDRQ